MRFVLVSDRLSDVRGGIERHAAALEGELRRRGHSVLLVPPGDLRATTADGAEWLVFDGVHRLAILRHARRRPGGARLAIVPHGSFLEEVHHRELVAAGRWSPTGAYRLRRAFDRTLGRGTFGRFDRWFLLAHQELDDISGFLGVPGARCVVLPPFVSPEFLAALGAESGPPPLPSPYVAAVSRLDARKNLSELLRAADGAPFSVAIAGQDRGGLAPLQYDAQTLRGVRWRYFGVVSERNKVAMLRGADALVVPSISEGIPAIALEALCLGRPVVLAGFAYGPEHPAVVRCAPDPASLSIAIGRARALPAFLPIAPPTVEEYADRFLSALEAA